MSIWGGVAEKANEALRLYHTIDEKLKNLDDNLKLMRTEITAFRTEYLTLAGRVSALEEARQTVAEQMNVVKAETRSEVEIAKAQMQRDLEIAKSEALTRLENEYTRRWAERYEKLVSLEFALTHSPAPQIPNRDGASKVSGSD